MAPTTLEGQKTTTSPYGRESSKVGKPMKMVELVSHFDGVVYAERVSCNTPANTRKAKRAIQKAFNIQMKGLGTTFIEVASNCPSGWKCTPITTVSIRGRSRTFSISKSLVWGMVSHRLTGSSEPSSI